MGSFLSTLFIEGWAFYCERMMKEHGFDATPTGWTGWLDELIASERSDAPRGNAAREQK